MRSLFTVARKEQPSVIFFDEIDAMMSARKVRFLFYLLCRDRERNKSFSFHLSCHRKLSLCLVSTNIDYLLSAIGK